MRWHVFLLALIVIAASPLYGVPQGHSRQPGTWYERAARQINPSDTDYGAIWEQYKQDLLGQLRNPYFRYGFAATLAIVMLLGTMVAQHLSHRRGMETAVQCIADIQRHDEYARQAAREAIHRYNDHIEKCNRVIEADEGGLWKWISAAELGAMKNEIRCFNEDLKAAQQEIDRLNGELNAKSVTIADISLRSQKSAPESEPPLKPSVPPPHIQRIN
jgi:hypothetical protein